MSLKQEVNESLNEVFTVERSWLQVQFQSLLVLVFHPGHENFTQTQALFFFYYYSLINEAKYIFTNATK